MWDQARRARRSALLLSLLLSLGSGCGGCAEAGLADAGPDLGRNDPGITGSCRTFTRRVELQSSGRTIFVTLYAPSGAPIPVRFDGGPPDGSDVRLDVSAPVQRDGPPPPAGDGAWIPDLGAADLRSSLRDTGPVDGPIGDAGPPCPVAPFPPVLIVPTVEQTVAQYASYAEHLASWGFAAVTVDPGPALVRDHRALAADLSVVLDWIQRLHDDPSSELYLRVVPGRAGALGHGAGAAVAMLAARQDSRLRAIAALDPVDGDPLGDTESERYPSLVPEQIGLLRIPLLFIGELLSTSCEPAPCRPCVPAAESLQQFFALASSAAIEVIFYGAGHFVWLDDPQCGTACDRCAVGAADRDRVRRLTRRFVTAFFSVELRREPEAARLLCTSDRQPAPSDRALISCRSRPASGLDGGPP